MKFHNIVTLLFIVASSFSGFSQDYEYATEHIKKVEIVSRVSVVIKPHDAPSFLISSKDNKRISKKSKGLKSIFGKDNTGFNVFVEEINGTLKVESFQPRTAKDLIIYLPKTMNIYAENLINNDISISDFTSEIEAKVDNGDIRITNVNGPVIIENVNGTTTLVFNTLSQSSPMSIINSHGDVDMTLPSDSNADIEVYAPRGELYTDFDLVPIENQNNKDGDPTESRYIKTKLNNGGVNISIVSSRGDIYLRKR